MKDVPIYKHPATYAQEHNELSVYRASNKANTACKEAIESAIRDHYRNNRLGTGAIKQVVEQFGYDRVFYVLAITVQQKDWDARISPENKDWAKTIPVFKNPDAFGTDRNCYFVVNSHPGLIGLFLNQARAAHAQDLQKPPVHDTLKKQPNEMALIQLKTYHYDVNDRLDEALIFAVPKTWFMEHCNMKSDSEIEKFLSEYTSDDSMDIYSYARVARQVVYEFDALDMSNEEIAKAALEGEKAFLKKAALNESKTIKILSVEVCEDETYGETIIQYEMDNKCISFAFSSIDAKEAAAQPELVCAEILNNLANRELPAWSDLSKSMLDLITDSEFDMNFIEYDDDDWTKEKAEEIWEESVAKGLDGVVRAGEDGCYITVYAGAMGSVNWANHPVYGKPYLDHVLDNSYDEHQKAGINVQIRSAEAKSVSQSIPSENPLTTPIPER